MLKVDEVPTTPGHDKVTVLIGRFQPVTFGGHGKMYNEAKKLGHPVVIFVVRGEKSDPKKSPFPLDLTIEMVRSTFPEATVLHVGSAFIGDFVKILRDQNMEPTTIFCGTDRAKSYRKQIESYSDVWNLKLDLHEVERNSEDVSATSVRDAIKNNDRILFQNMTAPQCHHYFDKLLSFLK